MGIYLPNMEMPTAGMCKTITIFDDGAVVEGNGSEKLGMAVPVPPHGRLGDLDKMKESIRKQTAFLRILGGEFAEIAETLEKGFLQEIDNAPTIIPAEEGE